MSKNRILANKMMKGLRDSASALQKGEKITEKFTCRKVTLDLHPIPYNPKQVKATRRLLHCSQAVFAQFLGVKVSAVQSWEQGRQTPSDMACRFMDEIQRDAPYWRKRLRQAVRVKQSC